ncbi:MAG TPA: tetratricopeptide repeat protein, partial [Nevskiaceae bacterium]|nr:tetratricopeptide repeat protein [Nevskiaceae bacterium]
FDRATGNNSVRAGPELWLVHAEALRRAGDAALARTFARRALEASRRYDDPSALSIARAQIVLADAELDLGEAGPARQLAGEARAILAAHRQVPDHDRKALGRLEARLGRA